MVRPASGAHPRRVFAVLAIGVIGFGVLQSLVLPILPTVQHHFGTSQHDVTWVLTAYLLSASVATPILGRIGDTFGKEKVLVLTLAVLAIGCVLAAVAPSLGFLIAARAVQGIGGGVLPLSFGIIRDEFPPAGVAGAIGAVSGLLAFGGGLGAVVAGPIVDWLDFRWLFWFSAIAVAPAALLVALVVPASPVRLRSRINVPAALLLSAGLTALLLGVSQGPVWDWAPLPVISLFAAAALLLAGWVRVELRSTHPLIDMRMLRRPAVRTTNLAAVFFGAGQFTVVGFLPTYVQTPVSAGYGFGSSLTESSLFLLPQTLCMALFGVLSGLIGRRIGAKGSLLSGLVLTVVAYVGFAWFSTEKWEILVGSAVLGAGMGLSVAAMATIVVGAVPPEQTGVASGMSANMRTVGGCVGAAVMSTVVAGDPQLLVPSAGDWRNGFLFLAGCAVVALVAAVTVPVRRAGAVTVTVTARTDDPVRTAERTTR
ncbi:MFS transporter [Nakamurella sp. YIM 132087]|uniref:MFS transporter n=1 Tax=Nakamurella alba TaxID=2665158 RepID=A0A7K1FRV9_9ACTN|nr:MFS transporter [Nakamurella alba]MTD15973.1 MFS transporter [Nakamurella alba]